MFSQTPYGRGFGGDPMGLQGGGQMPMQGGPPMHMQADARLGNPMMPLHSQLSPYPAPVLSRPLPPQGDVGFGLGGFAGPRPGGDGGFGLGAPRPNPQLSRPGGVPGGGMGLGLGMGGGPGPGMGAASRLRRDQGGPGGPHAQQGGPGGPGARRGPGGGGGFGGGPGKGGGFSSGPGGYGGGGGAKGGKGKGGGGGGMPSGMGGSRGGMPGGGSDNIQWTYGQGTGTSRTTTKGGKDGKGKGMPALGSDAGGTHSNIFVGNLADGTTQADLEQNFVPFGTVQSCVVTTKAGRTYGFVKLSTASAAARAIAALNGSSGWLVKFANNDSGSTSKGMGGKGGFGKGWDGGKGYGSGGKVTHANVFIGSLAEGTSEATLKDAFSPYGMIKSCYVRNKGDQTYGFCEFNTVSEAEAAIAGMAGKNDWVVKFANNDAWDDEVPHSNVYIGNMTEGTTEASLRATCGTYGTVESCTLKTDTETGKNYGFVKFSTQAAASRAITALNGGNDGWTVKAANNDTGGGGGKGWGGKGGWSDGWVWQPGPSTRNDDSRPEGPPSDNLYVKDLPPGITEDEVFAAFSKVGQVVDCYVLRWDNLSACAALVRMASTEQATRAKSQLSGTIHESCFGPISVKNQEKNGEKLEDHVYVKGIHCTTSEDQLRSIFGKYGTVMWCRILPLPFRAGAGSSSVPDVAGLVQFATPEEATTAISAMDGKVATEFGAPMVVRFAEEKANAKRPAPTPNNNLYVKGWPVGFPEFLLQSEFQKCGNVVRLRLLDNPDPEYPTCAALVQMSRVEEATMAVTALHGRPLQVPLPPMRVKFAGKDQGADNSNLYVTSLPRTMTESQIRQSFSKFGEIERLKLLTQQGKPETHALVQLSSPQAAAAAIRELDGSTPAFKGPMLNVTYAMKRELRE
eukprot:CAMPEP_0195053748 /NCGR_PEP_ID=MMETSP0448-20130528/2783_1 /TAXON_ID=66468 /ORGANISM="Heterocapsa triquestra, Strain CCMP 448" /LENGTH=906 /DNA_ID=CAMNT_0040083087 /DNA_START=73 /DNA_END=2793 /DNA_ORIENTATION=+